MSVTHVMSSEVGTSFKRFLHSLRSVGMTTGGKMYIVPFLGNDMSVYTCHVERRRDIFKKIPPLTSFGRNDNQWKDVYCSFFDGY